MKFVNLLYFLQYDCQICNCEWALFATALSLSLADPNTTGQNGRSQASPLTDMTYEVKTLGHDTFFFWYDILSFLRYAMRMRDVSCCHQKICTSNEPRIVPFQDWTRKTCGGCVESGAAWKCALCGFHDTGVFSACVRFHQGAFSESWSSIRVCPLIPPKLSSSVNLLTNSHGDDKSTFVWDSLISCVFNQLCLQAWCRSV